MDGLVTADDHGQPTADVDRALLEARELYETTREICSRLDLDDVLQAIVQRANRVLGADVAYLATCDDAQRVLRMRAFDNVRSPKFKALEFPYGFGLGGAVAAERRPMMVNNYQFGIDERVRHLDDIEQAVLDEGLRGGAATPVEFEGRLLAVLFVAKRVPHRFTEHQLTVLSSLANAAAIALNNAQAHSRLVASMRIHDNLMAIALADRGPRAVARTLADLVHGSVVLLDWQGRVLAEERIGGRPLTVPSVAELAGDCARPSDDAATKIIAIRLGGQTEGYLLADLENADEELGVTAVEQAGTVFALELAKLRSTEQTELRLRGGLLNELFTKPDTDKSTLLRHAAQLGCDLRAPHVVAVVRYRDDVDLDEQGGQLLRRLLHNILRVCHGLRGGTIVAERGATVVALVPAQDPMTASRLVEEGLEQCRRARLPEVIAGIGSATAQLGDYADSAAESARAVDVGVRGDRHRSVVRFDQLDFHQLLLGARPAAELSRMARRQLAPLIDYDARRGGALVHTVGVFFECNGNVEAAARKLNLHPNSLRGRLVRISELLDCDLGVATTRLDLYLALESCRLTPDQVR